MARTYFPMLGQYLWMKIDHLAMVREVDGPEALAAAKELAQEAKTYVVFTRSVAGLPFGGFPTSQYTVDIVTRGPRLIDDTQGFSEDMYVPVHPFTHPEHQSVSPEPPLPFSDCAHWLGATVDVVVQRVPEGLNNNKAHDIPPSHLFRINSALNMEWGRLIEKHAKMSADATCEPPQIEDEDNAFGDSFVPLVKVGVDIGQQFNESDQLPHVYDYVEECLKIKQILLAARALSRDTPAPDPEPEVSRDDLGSGVTSDEE